MGIDETIKIIVANAPMFAGLVLCIWIQARTIDRLNSEHDANEKRHDALQAKVIEIALKCRDEVAKQELSEYLSDKK